jgi:hypothetical protein
VIFCSLNGCENSQFGKTMNEQYGYLSNIPIPDAGNKKEVIQREPIAT